MLKGPTPEIEAEVLSEYEKDSSGFFDKLHDELLRSNPGVAGLFSSILENTQTDRFAFQFGLHMASVVYRQLEKASGTMPVVDRVLLEKISVIAQNNAGGFLRAYALGYLRKKVITTKTVDVFFDSLPYMDDRRDSVLFVAVLLVRIIEAQIESDLNLSKTRLN